MIKTCCQTCGMIFLQLTKRRPLFIILTKLCSFDYFKQKSDVSRERGSFEELTMTLLQMMTSSGKLTSRECRQVLEKFRSQVRSM